MATDEKRRILEMVASKEITPSEGVELLSALGADPKDELPATKVTEEATGITSVKVSGTFKSLKVEADSSISGAVADGPHQARVVDGKLIIEDEPTEGDDDPGFVLFGPSRWRGVRIDAKGGKRSYKFDSGAPPLKIMMNPDLPLDLELTAGTARVSGITAPIEASLTAGTARFEGVRSPFKASVDAGSLHVEGKFDSGTSEIRCTAGKVDVNLDKSSSVKIDANATLGKITLPGVDPHEKVEWAGIGGGHKEVVIGAGEGTLQVDATTGKISVRLVG